MGSVGEVGFANGGCGIRVGRGQESSVVAFVFDNPAHHAHRQSAVGAGIHGQPLPGFGRGFAEARVYHGNFQVAVDHGLGDSGSHIGGAKVGFKRAGAKEDNKFTVQAVGFELGFLAAGHFIVGNVVALLADGDMQIEVGRAKAIVGKAFAQLFATVLHAPAHRDELVVDRPGVGMVGVNEHIQVGGVAIQTHAVDDVFRFVQRVCAGGRGVRNKRRAVIGAVLIHQPG